MNIAMKFPDQPGVTKKSNQGIKPVRFACSNRNPVRFFLMALSLRLWLCRAAIATPLIVLNSATLSQVPFDRFTPELSARLERNALTAHTRGLYQTFAVDICQRASPGVAAGLRAAAQAWKIRNDTHLRAAAQALSLLADRHIAAGGERAKQQYLANVLHSTTRQALSELERDFDGASPENEKAPDGEKCKSLSEFLNAGRVDFVNTPNSVVALEQFMQKRAEPPK